MKSSLQPGVTWTSTIQVDHSLTVPAIAPQFSYFAAMPLTFATMGLVGFVEQACLELLDEHLDYGEFTVGSDVQLTHTVPSPVGATLTAHIQVITVEPKAVVFAVTVSDDEDVISVGQHRRAILNRERFETKLAEKADRIKG